MATVQELEQILKDQKFWNLPVDSQAQFVQDALQDIYGEGFSGLPAEGRQKLVQFAINEARPAGLVERGLSMIPLVGPLVEQYGYGRQVKASPTVRKLVGEEAGTEYGALLKAGEEVVLLGGSMLALSYAAPGLLAGTALEGASMLVNHILRESTIGGLYEVGKLITDFPGSVGEAAFRVGAGAAVFGATGGAFRAAGTALRGRFGELLEPAGNKVNINRLTRELGGTQEYADFADRVARYDTSNDASVFSDTDVAAMLSAAGERNSASAEQLRVFARDIQREHQITAEVRSERLASDARLRTELLEKEIGAAQQESDLANRVRQAEELRRTNLAEVEEEATLRAMGRPPAEPAVELGEREAFEAERAEQATLARETRAVALQGRVKEIQTAELSRLGERARLEQTEANLAGIEAQRQQAVDAELFGLGTKGSPHTKPELMLREALSSTDIATQGFVGREPITLPLGMIDARTSEAVMIDRFNDGQAILRGGKGFVPRTALRFPQTQEERIALNTLVQREGVGSIPSRSEALSILRSRVVADRAIRFADAQAVRPDFDTNVSAQAQEFGLRREAVESFLSATNRQFSEVSYTALREVQPLAGTRSVASLENIPTLQEASDIAHALSGAGFNNVRIQPTPERTADIVFTRGDSVAEQAVSRLYTRYASKHGIVDPTDRTYSGLTADEHEVLGRAFGLPQKAIDRYKKFINQTLDETNARGIRVPADANTLGVDTIEKQVLTKQRSATVPRPEAIVDAERLQRFEKGDWLTVPSGPRGQLRSYKVTDIDHSAGNLILADEREAIVTQPSISVADLRASGARRDVSMSIGVDPQAQLNQLSPARTLDELINPAARSAPLAPTPLTRRGVETALRQQGMRVSVSPSGEYRVTLQGAQMRFSNLEDTARFVDTLRAIGKDKGDLIGGLGGKRCL